MSCYGDAKARARKNLRDAEANLEEARRQVEELETRQTGRSTAQALSALAWCYGHPGAKCRIRDHSGVGFRADATLVKRILGMAATLGLRGYRGSFEGGQAFVTYEAGHV